MIERCERTGRLAAVFDSRIVALLVDAQGVSVTLLPRPDRHFFTVDLERPSRKGVSFRLALGDRALCARWRTIVGTGVQLITKDRILQLWPR